MIKICKATARIKRADYNFLICPKCNKGRLCDKPKNQKVVISITQTTENHIVLKCPKCSEIFFVESNLNTI